MPLSTMALVVVSKLSFTGAPYQAIPGSGVGLILSSNGPFGQSVCLGTSETWD